MRFVIMLYALEIGFVVDDVVDGGRRIRSCSVLQVQKGYRVSI